MAKKSDMQLRVERIAKFASKDPSRPVLGLVESNDELKALIATDGTRAIVDVGAYLYGRGNFSANVYLKTGEILVDNSGAKYPNVKGFMPNIENYTEPFVVKIPEWFSHLDKAKKPAQFYFDSACKMSIDKHSDVAFSLDARLLAPLAGCVLNLRYHLKKPKIGAIHFEFSDDREIYGVLMPMRM